MMMPQGVCYKDGQGYVYWNGVQIEHYSYRDKKQETAALTRLTERCLSLESRGLPVNGMTAIWLWDWFKGMERDHVLRDFLLRRPEFVQHGYTPEQRKARLAASVPVPEDFPDHDGVVGWYFLSADDKVKSERYEDDRLLWVWDGKQLTSRVLDPVGHWDSMCHRCERAGYSTAMMGQGPHLGTCYATLDQIVAWLVRYAWLVRCAVV